MNWRDESLRKEDRPPKHGGRPDVVPESDRSGRGNKDGGRGRGRGRSNERERPKKNRDKDGNIIIKKYEEPEKVVRKCFYCSWQIMYYVLIYILKGFFTLKRSSSFL